MYSIALVSSHRAAEVSRLALLTAGLIITFLLWLSSTNEVTLVQAASSFLALSAAAWTYSTWKVKGYPTIPVFAFVIGAYWWYFTFELFWGGRAVYLWQTGAMPVDGKAISAAMIAMLIGVFALLLGSEAKVFPPLEKLKQWDLVDDPKQWTWLRVILAAGTLITLADVPLAFLGDGVRQIIVLFETMAPSVAFVILFRIYLRGLASNVDKLLIAAFLVLRFVGGMASGWLGSAASMAIIVGAVYLSERRKVPAWAPALLAVYVLFFQVGKSQYRQQYWNSGQSAASSIDRLSYWFDVSLGEWQKAIADNNKQAYVQLISQSFLRTSLLTQVASLIERTPRDVRFQKGKTYSYFLVTWIPRFLWPGKPSVNEANQFYQVAYGITSEESLNKVSIAVGSLGEAYMNFGWLGIPLVMFLIGVVISNYQQLFLSRNSGVLLFGIGIALVPQILMIEGQLAQYLSGVIQSIAFCIVVFSPILRRRCSCPITVSHRDLRPLLHVQL